MVGAAFEFQGVLTGGLVLVVVGLVAFLVWFLTRMITRENVTRTIARQIWSPDRRDCLQLVLSTGVEIGPSGYGDGDFTFDYPRGACPVALRFRGARVSSCPQCFVSVRGEKMRTEWQTGGEVSDRFHDLVLDGVVSGDRVEGTFALIDVSTTYPYISSHIVAFVIVPPEDDDATVGVDDGEATLPLPDIHG